MQFKIVHNRIGSDIWANTRLRIIKKILKCKNKLILDLGCGKGYVGIEFQKENKVIFADIDKGLLKNIRGIKILVNAAKLPFKKSIFDYVICADVLEHIEKDEQALQEIYRVLKPRGKAIIALPAYSCLYGHHDKLIGHYRRYDRVKFIEVAEKIGFKVRYSRYSLSLLFFPFLFNQIVTKSNKAYIGKSRIEKKLIPILSLISWIESSVRLPFGINLLFVLEK